VPDESLRKAAPNVLPAACVIHMSRRHGQVVGLRVHRLTNPTTTGSRLGRWLKSSHNGDWTGFHGPPAALSADARATSSRQKGWGGVKKDLAIIRAVEAVIAFVIVVVLYQFVSAGVLTSIGESATGWYSQKMDGLVIISVVDTSIKLPHLDRASLPIAPALEAPGGPTASESPAAADEDTTPATT